MIKRFLIILLGTLLIISLVSCNSTNNTSSISSNETTSSLETSSIITNTETSSKEVITPITENDDYEVKALNIYREKDVVDKTIDIRFYNETPHIPYIAVSQYYKEFFKNDLTIEKNNSTYKYVEKDGGFLAFDAQNNIFTAYSILNFSKHPDFNETTSKTFVNEISSESTTGKEISISLNNYGFVIYGDENEAYVPITFLSSFSGGASGYNISYNGKDIYVLDARGQLSSEPHDAKYFGEEYYSILSDLDTPRYEDLAKYSYGQLCFDFDYLRGYTSQLLFGDNNLLSLGLNGLLEKYYPKIKECLLSLDKLTYYEGYNALFAGLYDGGHTANITTEEFMIEALKKAITDPDLRMITTKYILASNGKLNLGSIIQANKSKAFEDYKPNENSDQIYSYDSSTKIAYICFDHFVTDYDGWDNYYNNGMNKDDIPVATDSYAFVRNCFYKALADGAEHVIIDLTTNGGGNSSALSGITGLVNKGTFSYEMNNVFSKVRLTSNYGIDIDLDGDFDEDDTVEAQKFTFDISVLTSSRSFSCGNLLPSVLKEFGCKIIGQKSGGGSCSLYFSSTAEGITQYHSSFNCLTNNSGNNIDSGVDLDFEIPITTSDSGLDYSKFYDFVTIAEYLNTL